MAGVSLEHVTRTFRTKKVEIRAVALHAVEVLCRALQHAGVAAHARDLDTFLWNRGAAEPYKAIARHRTRCVFY